MQSGYGGVSEIQQFMVDGGCPSSLFSISTAPPNAASPSAAAEIHLSQKFNPFPHPHHHHHQQQQQQHHPPPPPQHLQHHHSPAPPHFLHFGHPNPITQQLFQQTHHHHPHHHQFQLFHHQQHHLGLDQESGPENSNSPVGGGPSFLPAMNFKLGVNESGGGGGRSREGLNEDDGILQGDDGSESRLHHSWHREEESTANIKEPFWRPLDIDYINPNNKRPAKDKQPAEISSNVKHLKKSNNEAALDHNQHSSNNNNANTGTTDSNYKLFSELEAIYKPGGGPAGANNQTGSGASALTGDDNPLMPASAPWPTIEQQHQTDNISDTSNGGDAPQPPQPLTDKSQKGKSKRSKRARQQKQLASIAAFFESLVKQLMDHQEELHRKFLEVMERRDQERTNREEAWRKQEAAKANREVAARAQERALAAAREAAIISFLEKITGESLNLPTKVQFQSQAQFTDESQQKDHHDDSVEPQNALEPYNADSANNNNIDASGGGGGIQLGSSRWPKAEVQALIRVRSGLETRFQEPGLKGPLWEEVSLAMAGLGYQRSAKRCKEKWENINKYFRKTKDSGKKRPQHSKTCPYFHQLDQLYSKPVLNAATTASVTPSSSNANMNEERKENSELLDAIVVSNEAGKRNAEFNEANNEDEEQGGDEEEGGDHGEEGQGESQETRGQGSENVNTDYGRHQQQQLQPCEGEQSAQRDSAHFFHRLRT